MTIFGGFSAVWQGVDRGDVPDGDLTIRKVAGGVERVAGTEITIGEDAVREALGTGLFSSKGTNRLGWSHQTYAEFLAASYLVEQNFTTTQAMSLIALPADKEGRLAPQLHETAAWLATMRTDVFRRIMESDPSVLLLSDVATADPTEREKLAAALLKLYDEEKLLDSNWDLRSLYRKLGHPALAMQLRPYITDAKKGPVVRRVAIDIAEACAIQSLQNDLADLALDSQQDVPTRVQAAYALARIGDAATKARVKPLASGDGKEDVQDELKGCALEANWPTSLTADEMFNVLTPPKQENFGGAYSHFLSWTLPRTLERVHLVPALNWLRRQRTRRELLTTLEKVADRIMVLALESLSSPDVLVVFSDVVLSRLRSHDTIVSDDAGSVDESAVDTNKRRLLVERLVPQLIDKELHLLVWSRDRLLRPEDFSWLLGKLKTTLDENSQTKWLRIIPNVFDPKNQSHLEALFAEAPENPQLAAAFSYILNPIELNSEAARLQKAQYEEMQKEKEKHNTHPILTPPPAERIATCLQQFEAGNLDAWWWLNLEMTLRSNSRYYDETGMDLTSLPGWMESDTTTRQRIINAAQCYIQNANPNNDTWLEKDIWYRPAIAGYRAFLLLAREGHESLVGLGKEVWGKWAATFLAASSGMTEVENALKRFMVETAYASASEEVICALRILIERENVKFEHLMVTDKIAHCWDEKLAEALYLIAQDEKLKPEFVRTLLDLLLQNGHTGAYSFATSLVPLPLPVEGKARKMAVVGAAALLGHAHDGGWSVIWPAFQADTQFGKEVVSLLAPGSAFQGPGNMGCLTESQHADLYRWLTEAYPEVHSDDGARRMGTRDFASGWRNGILTWLQSCGTENGCAAIQRLMKELPQLSYLKWSLQAARETTRFRNWEPVPPDQILQMARDANRRLVRDGAELLAVVIEALERLKLKLRGETALVANLWNEVSAKVWEPKDEEHFSDNVKQFLEDDLRSKGIVLNREVVIRRSRGATKGERTDIHIDAVVRNDRNDDLDVITVIVEVKGCWHPELWTAMQSQLSERYLHESHCRHGLYLVGWFNCPQWNPKDTRRAPQATLREAQERLNNQARELSHGPLLVRAVVLDTSLR